MQVLFRSPRAPAVFTDPRNGQQFSGESEFELIFYAPGEQTSQPMRGGGPPRPVPTRSLATWRAATGIGKPLVTDPPEGIRTTSVVVPDAVVAALPDTARLTLRWRFIPSAP